MTNTGPAQLLTVWEAGLGRPGADRALLLHRAARPGAADGELLSVQVGEREADLYGLRRTLFGERMEVRVECGACGEPVEFDLSTDELAGQRAGRTSGGHERLRVTEGEWAVEFRLPTVADLDAVAGAGVDSSAPDARRLLLARCLLSAARAGEPAPVERLPGVLPEAVLRRISETAERADPTAEVTLKIACPECGETTPAELDITSYLWTELDAWARDLLLDVHLLAGAYGWSEPEILALSPLRRRYYLELCADV
ncbi:hypothetical protein [Streptomyces sp. TP-A0874]|uniref:T4 family baseplate hub assembly chaperone n=1 Tax=Streptomyces sp. TP-A0874 TaxID=549819 RepID=UPI00085341F3|nr:hypothetical protein [Streptomyces sp. TP-A0874]